MSHSSIERSMNLRLFFGVFRTSEAGHKGFGQAFFEGIIHANGVSVMGPRALGTCPGGVEVNVIILQD